MQDDGAVERAAAAPHAAAAGAGGGPAGGHGGAPASTSLRQPQWEAGSSTVLDPLEARERAVRAHAQAAGSLSELPPELLGSRRSSDDALLPSASAAAEPAAAAADDAAFASAFDAMYEHAADAAAVALMTRATARGEKFSGHIGQADFVAAVSLMASQLGLAPSLDAPQIEQLFDAVSGGAPAIQFEDFVDAASTRYYLLQLASACRAQAPKKEPQLEA